MATGGRPGCLVAVLLPIATQPWTGSPGQRTQPIGKGTIAFVSPDQPLGVRQDLLHVAQPGQLVQHQSQLA